MFKVFRLEIVVHIVHIFQHSTNYTLNVNKICM